MSKEFEIINLPKKVVDSEWQDDVPIEDQIEDSFEYYDEDNYVSPKSVNEAATNKSIDFIKRHEKVKLGFGKFALSMFDQVA